MANNGNTLAKVGAWAFIAGIVIALVLGVLTSYIPVEVKGLLVSVLVIAGLIVGFLNVTEKETTAFLMASVAIMIALYTAGQQISLSFQALGFIGDMLKGILAYINLFVFPATVVVAMKAIYAMAKDA